MTPRRSYGIATTGANATCSRASSTPCRGRRRSTKSAGNIAASATFNGPSIAISASSSGCSKRSRATIAVSSWRAPTSRRRPARSTPCWRTPPDGWTERPATTGSQNHGRAMGAPVSIRPAGTYDCRLLQEQLVPHLLPFRRLVGPFDRIDHYVFMLIEQRLLGPARRHAAHVAEQLLALW